MRPADGWGVVMGERLQGGDGESHGLLLTGMQLGIAGMRTEDLHRGWKGGGEERGLEEEGRNEGETKQGQFLGDIWYCWYAKCINQM